MTVVTMFSTISLSLGFPIIENSIQLFFVLLYTYIRAVICSKCLGEGARKWSEGSEGEKFSPSSLFHFFLKLANK